MQNMEPRTPGEASEEDLNRASREASKEAPGETLRQASKEASREAWKEASREASKKGVGEASREASKKSVGEASREASKKGVGEASREASKKSVGEASREASKKGVGEASREALGEALREASIEGVGEASREAIKEASGEASREALGEASREASREASKEASKEALGEDSRETSKEALGEASRQTSKEALGEASREASKEASGEASREASIEYSGEESIFRTSSKEQNEYLISENDSDKTSNLSFPSLPIDSGAETSKSSQSSSEEQEDLPMTRGGGVTYEEYLQFFLGEPCIPRLSRSTSSSSMITCAKPTLQRTIVIVKPEAMIYKEVILRAIFEAGFQIIGRRVIHLTPEQVSEIYSKYYGSTTFPNVVVSTSSGPVLVMSIAAMNAISRWKLMIGVEGSVKEEWFFPISMRKRFGLQQSMPNALHGSANSKESDNENRYFFSKSILEPMITKRRQVKDFCNLYVNPTLLNGLAEVVKRKPSDPILFLADWLLMNNPFQPGLSYHRTKTGT